jgi:hypothetical protein
VGRATARASALVCAGAVAVSIAAATPALAVSDRGRTLPAGDEMFAVACEGFDYPRLQLFSVDARTAGISTVGAGSEIGETSCAGTVAIDPTTGITYFVGWDGAATYLARLDLTTGVATWVAPFAVGADEPYIEAIAIGLDGKAYAIGQMSGTPNGGIYGLDLTTGALDPTAPVEEELDALIVNPETGGFIGLGFTGKVYDLDVTDGSTELSFDLSAILDEMVSTDNLAFDSSGVLWFTAKGMEHNRIDPNLMMQDLWSIDPADLENSLRHSGPLSDLDDADPAYIQTEALFISQAADSGSGSGTDSGYGSEDDDATEVAAQAPAKGLAETGVDAATPIFLSGALGAALAGAALVVGARFRRRSYSGR